MKSLSVPPLFFAVLVTVAAAASAGGYPPSLVQHDCFKWYSENITGTVRVYKPNDKKEIPSTPDEMIRFASVPIPLSTDSDCKGKASKSLRLTFGGADNTKIEVNLVVRVRGGRSWHLVENETEVVVTVKNERHEFLANSSRATTDVTAGHSFSFSCSRLRLNSGRATLDRPWNVDLQIHRFQLQPFNGTGRRVFEDSFDCATWFTIPLWTGFLVTLLFTAILSFGVFALLEIKTPDRFENPKGKTITVTATD